MSLYNSRICCEYQYIFIHIPKTAGNSIAACLASFPRYQETPEPYRKIYKHTKACDYKKLIDADSWQSFFKFSIVRNPWDLMVSSYHWWLHTGHKLEHTKEMAAEVEKLGSFRNFITSRFGRGLINECSGEILDWITEQGEIIVDFVGRFEHLATDWQTVCHRIGVESRSLPMLNQSDRRHYRSYYDSETRDIVAQRFTKTIELFGYTY